jgi:hypothetical protein
MGISLNTLGWDVDTCQVQDLDSWLQERALMTDVVKQHLLRAQVRMKTQADKHRSEVQFSVGDQVFLKLQPYVQSSLAHMAHQKLSFMYFGPYVITELTALYIQCFMSQNLRRWVLIK